MVSAGNDLQVLLLGESDFRSVVAMEGDALEDVPEITLQLLVAVFGNGVAMACATRGVLGHRTIVHGAKQSGLLHDGNVGKVLAEQLVAKLLDALECLQNV